MQGIIAKNASNSPFISFDSILLKIANPRHTIVAEDVVFLLSPVTLKFYLILMIYQKYDDRPIREILENSQIKNEFSPDQITMCLDELQQMDLAVIGVQQ